MAVTFSDDASSVVVASETHFGASLYMYGEEKAKPTNDSKQQSKLPLPEIKWEHHKIHDKSAVLTLVGAAATYGSADGSTVVASCSEGMCIHHCTLLVAIRVHCITGKKTKCYGFQLLL